MTARESSAKLPSLGDGLPARLTLRNFRWLHPLNRSRPTGEAGRDLSSAPDARVAQYSEYERVVNELYAREVFCVHHELQRFDFNPRTSVATKERAFKNRRKGS
jgi:hypothetical protein